LSIPTDPLASVHEFHFRHPVRTLRRRGVITLNRPKALNAVTHEMVRALAHQLEAWAQDGAVTRVIVTAAGERAFSPAAISARCTNWAGPGGKAEALTFWREEYPLNA